MTDAERSDSTAAATGATSAVPAFDQPYDPGLVEPRWYAFWEANGVFATSDSPADKRPAYVIPMPAASNVTGSLHMGHAHAPARSKTR